MKKISFLLILLLMVSGTSTSSVFGQAWDDCVIPASGPWPPCASGGGDSAPTPPSNGGCEIPASGPWPPCASGGGGGTAPTPPSNGGCEIPASGPWPPCASGGGGGTAPTPPSNGGCEIPASGPWPPCASGGGGGSTPPPANPAPAPPPPSGGGSLPGGYLLGAQTHTFAHPTEMKNAGMQWVKLQHKWVPGHDGEAVRERIEIVHSQGMKVLLSIVGQPYPTSIDFNAYVQFLGVVAAENPDAIEIWSESNIDFEWPAGQINATSYVNNMLKPGYQRIKAVDPSILVISAAPAPTGFFGGGCSTNGCDDKPYVEEMFSAGAGNYLDCVGIHYNAGILSPNASSGDPRDSTGHYSWYYPTMVSTYREIIGDKPLCFTELGYLSFDGFDSISPAFAWATDTSVEEQAQWLGEAVTLTKSDPGIAMMIIFNMDIESFGDDPQAGYGMIRPDGSCPSCWTVKSAAGR